VFFNVGGWVGGFDTGHNKSSSSISSFRGSFHIDGAMVVESEILGAAVGLVMVGGVLAGTTMNGGSSCSGGMPKDKGCSNVPGGS